MTTFKSGSRMSTILEPGKYRFSYRSRPRQRYFPTTLSINSDSGVVLGLSLYWPGALKAPLAGEISRHFAGIRRTGSFSLDPYWEHVPQRPGRSTEWASALAAIEPFEDAFPAEEMPTWRKNRR